MDKVELSLSAGLYEHELGISRRRSLNLDGKNFPFLGGYYQVLRVYQYRLSTKTRINPRRLMADALAQIAIRPCSIA